MKPSFLNLFRKKLTRDRVVPDHLCKGFLTHLGDYGLGLTFLAEMSQQ
jgi:hypothetical protein